MIYEGTHAAVKLGRGASLEAHRLAALYVITDELEVLHNLQAKHLAKQVGDFTLAVRCK